MAALLLAAACGGDSDPAGPAPRTGQLDVLAGGNNVPERYSSDLWVSGGFAFTGTWGGGARAPGNVVKVWALSTAGAPTLPDSINVPQISTVSDVEVSADGEVLLFGGENGPAAGFFLYDVADPTNALPLDAVAVPGGVHTATFAEIGGRRYVFAARNPSGAAEPALLIYDATDPANAFSVATVPIPPLYGIHDTFVRDGLAFVFAWNTGVIIYDVGNGRAGGRPDAPVEISRLVTSANNVAGGPAAHNGWWFHNPTNGERRYLFVGQEGPGTIGSRSSGDIHALDVSDLAAPREVAFFHLDGAGTHNFWVDEARQILYAAYYNGGVVALDISGTLSGNLSGRLIARAQPGGAGNTYTWGVQLAGGYLYAIDMISGLWQLQLRD